MSDLSRLLDDVYGTAGEPTVDGEAAAVFSGWLPEPRRSGRPDLVVVPDPVEALEAILDNGVQEQGAHRPEAEPEPEPAPEPARRVEPARTAPERPAGRTWSLRDDDILPAKAPRRRLRLRRR